MYIAAPYYGSPLSYFGLHPDIGHDVGFSKFLDQPPIENTLNLSFAMASRDNNNSDGIEDNSNSTAIALILYIMLLLFNIFSFAQKSIAQAELLRYTNMHTLTKSFRVVVHN